MTHARPHRLRPPISQRDHAIGSPDANITLVEYGSYACRHCHAAHDVIANLQRRFGDEMRYVFRHRPLRDSIVAESAAVLAEYAFETTGEFWPIHAALMTRGPAFTSDDLEQIASEFGIPPLQERSAVAQEAAVQRVQEDTDSAVHSGAAVTPTFFINGRRYEGPWDETSMAEALERTMGHRIQTATLDFVRWGPSAGLLLLLMSVAAVVLANSRIGPWFVSWWTTSLGLTSGGKTFSLLLTQWVNDGLLSLFFLVVGLEIKREFTIGRLSTLRAGALPVIAAFGGIVLPACLYLLTIREGPPLAGWGIPIGTDTAFAVAIMVMLGTRVPVELRVFFTAAVIIDDVVAIGVIALFYSEAIDPSYLTASFAITSLLVGLNYWGIYAPLPYGLLGVALWICLHESGIHATLSGVLLAMVTPTRPPANVHALLGQAEAVIQSWTGQVGKSSGHHGPPEPVMRALDAIHDRMESPASKLLRSVEPWSSYVVLPLFALANAGVVWSADLLEGHGRLLLAIIGALVIGKPVGITLAAWLAVRSRMAVKPEAYSWAQLAGAGALGGIGFTMSLFIAGEAFSDPDLFTVAKIGIFGASLIAGTAGTLILVWANSRG
jgi:NhaA family Na+:H+ antiporter